MKLVPIETLNRMIAGGWGSVPRIRIPEDWETRPGPELHNGVHKRTWHAAVPAGLEESQHASASVEVLQTNGEAKIESTPEATS